MKVILDTNFLLIPAQFGVDIFQGIKDLVDEPVEFFIIEPQIDELNKIRNDRGSDARAANMALQMLDKYPITILKTEKLKNVDLIIAKTAVEGAFTVATQDQPLKEELRKNGIKIIVLKQKKLIRFENVL